MVVEKVCVVATSVFKVVIPEPPVELTISKEKPNGAVEEAVKTFPSAPVMVEKALVPEAIKTPLVNVPAPVPPLATLSAVARVTLPAESTLNLVEEFTCKFMKSPAKIGIFAPMNVPVAFPPAILYGPSWIRELVVVLDGVPVKYTAVVPEADKVRAPVPVAFVKSRLVMELVANVEFTLKVQVPDEEAMDILVPFE